jgi:hypothetical protein
MGENLFIVEAYEAGDTTDVYIYSRIDYVQW